MTALDDLLAQLGIYPGVGAPPNSVPVDLLFSRRYDKRDARRFTVTVTGGTVKYQINVPPFGVGENWQPMNGAFLQAGFWTFDQNDWTEYGTEFAQGMRFALTDPASPATVSVS